MSRQCFQTEIPATKSINLEEVSPLPQKEQLSFLKNGTPLYANYLQAIERYKVDIFTAEIFPAFQSKQNDFVMTKIFDTFKIKTHANLFVPDLDDLNATIEFWDYEIRNRSDVISFLLEHIELFPILQMAKNIISNYFTNPSLVLEVITDPEEENDSRILFINIQTNLSPSNALSKLEKLDEDWWLEISKEIGDILCLHVEYL